MVTSIPFLSSKFILYGVPSNSIGWSGRYLWLSVDMEQQPPAKKFVQLKCDEVVYFENFWFSAILRPWIDPLLTLTLTFKESYISRSHYQTNRITTYSKSGTMKKNVDSNIFEICGNGMQHCHNPRLWTWGILSVTLVVEVGNVDRDLFVEGTVHYVCEPNRSRKTQYF